MDENPFFRWLWRINALALPLVLLAAGLLLVPIALQFAVRPAVDEAVQSAKAPESRKPEYQWRVEQNQEGTQQTLLALELPREPSLYLSSGSGGAPRKTVNYLFVNVDTGETHWLFPTHDQEITDFDILVRDGPTRLLRMSRYSAIFDPDDSQVAYVFQVLPGNPVSAKPSERSGRQVYVSRPDGSALTKLLDSLDKEALVTPIGNDKIFVLAQIDDRTQVITFSVEDFRPVLTKDISELTPQ